MEYKKVKKEEIEKVAKLANISITQIEQDMYSDDLSKVVNYSVKHLEKLNTDNVSPTAHATGEKSITREDLTEPGLGEEEATRGARNKYNNSFKVKHIFGED